ncbi:MAG: hypothetical protein Q4D29_02450 [Lachnospiraceae bacterium]|nr:hypothetical protein [Lachnospiraceae bacterium]
MKKIISLLAVTALAIACVVVPAKNVSAATDGYVLTQQARDLVSQAQRERDDAQRNLDNARRRVDELRNSGISGGQLSDAYDDLDKCYRKLDTKEDKLNKARRVMDFVNTRSDSEIFLASMQEKFRNQASLGPMQDKIQGAKSIISAQTTQIQVIQQAIQSQTALAQVNPAIFAQVNELNQAYQVELAQLKQEQEELAHLQAEYDAFAATMPLPTMQDNMRLAEIRRDFESCCRDFDAACAE